MYGLIGYIQILDKLIIICIIMFLKTSHANHKYLKSHMHIDLSYEYELQMLPNAKVGATKDHGKLYKLKPFLVHHLLSNRLFRIVSVISYEAIS